MSRDGAGDRKRVLGNATLLCLALFAALFLPDRGQRQSAVDGLVLARHWHGQVHELAGLGDQAHA
jgi:hypothetical protein